PGIGGTCAASRGGGPRSPGLPATARAARPAWCAVTGPGQQAGHGDLWTLGRLLLGPFGRFRDPRLPHLATATLRDSGPARWGVPTVNAAIRVRATATRAACLEPRRLASRAAFALRPDRPAARARPLSMLCPTRGRPRWLAALLRSVGRTAH